MAESEHPRSGNATQDPITHVIVLMLENRAFDHMLGCCQSVYPSLDGIPPTGPARTNADMSGQTYPQSPGAARVLVHDPKHEYVNVLQQLAQNNAGFIDDYARNYPHSTATERAEVIKYHALDTLPALHTLARHFTICDHWFSSLPGPTWPNRLFVQSGTSLGRVTMPSGLFDANLHWYDQTTVYDRLNQKGINWKIYYGDVPLSFILVNQLRPENVVRHHKMVEFFEDMAGPPDQFPSYSFIEPTYLPPGANDDHPPHDVMDGQQLLAHVYNALRTNSPLWQSSDRLGVRVPALLVSPWVTTGVLSTTFDHTSLLKYLTEKWLLGPLGNRVAQAASFAPALRAGTPRTDTPSTIPGGEAIGTKLIVQPQQLSTHQQAVVALTQHLEALSEADPREIAMHSKWILNGPESQVEVAMARVERFVAQQRSRLGGR